MNISLVNGVRVDVAWKTAIEYGVLGVILLAVGLALYRGGQWLGPHFLVPIKDSILDTLSSLKAENKQHGITLRNYEVILSQLREDGRQRITSDARQNEILSRLSDLQMESNRIMSQHYELSRTTSVDWRIWKEGRDEAIGAAVRKVMKEEAGDPPPAVVVADESGTIIEWSPACVALFHWTSIEAVGMHIINLIPERYRQRHNASWKEVMDKQRLPRRGPYGFHARTKENGEIPVALILSGWTVDGRRFFGAAMRLRKDEGA